MATTTNACGICHVGARKYKCPLCRLPYCSTACYKTHKEVPCVPHDAAESTEPAFSSPATTAASSSAPTADAEDDVPLLTSEQLAVLSMSEKLKKALQDPATRSKIQAIDAHPDRLNELQRALTDPVFARFVYGMMDEVNSSAAVSTK